MPNPNRPMANERPWIIALHFHGGAPIQPQPGCIYCNRTVADRAMPGPAGTENITKEHVPTAIAATAARIFILNQARLAGVEMDRLDVPALGELIAVVAVDLAHGHRFTVGPRAEA